MNASLNISIDIFFILVIAFVFGKMIQGYKKGMVKEIISLVSLIIISLIVALLSRGLQSYLEKEFVGMLAAVISIAIIGIAHSFISVFFLTAKVVSKLPIVHWLDKVAGILVGALEGVLFLWILYYFITVFGLGSIGTWIMESTRTNDLLLWLAEHNYLLQLMNEYGMTEILNEIV